MTQYVETECLPDVAVTAVGSMPHTDAEKAVDLIMDCLTVAPHTPQLSVLDPREQMWIQFSEGLPRFKTDFDNQRFFFDTSGDTVSDIEAFYSNYLEIMDGKPADYFSIGSEYGVGIHAFFSRLQKDGRKMPLGKVQVTGPVSFAMTIPDQDGKAIFYDSVFRDIAIKAMALKAVWLLEQSKHFFENVIVFLDEPCLSAYGSSAYLGLSQQDVIESLNEVIEMILQKGGIPGVHCCGNTDWGLLMQTDTRIINFDAIEFMDTMAIYKHQLADFLSKGGVLAWGAAPNTDTGAGETFLDTVERIKYGLDLLEKQGLERSALLRKMIITPACGCAGMTVENTEKAYHILSELQSRSDDIFKKI